MACMNCLAWCTHEYLQRPDETRIPGWKEMPLPSPAPSPCRSPELETLFCGVGGESPELLQVEVSHSLNQHGSLESRGCKAEGTRGFKKRLFCGPKRRALRRSKPSSRDLSKQRPLFSSGATEPPKRPWTVGVGAESRSLLLIRVSVMVLTWHLAIQCIVVEGMFLIYECTCR